MQPRTRPLFSWSAFGGEPDPRTERPFAWRPFAAISPDLWNSVDRHRGAPRRPRRRALGPLGECPVAEGVADMAQTVPKSWRCFQYTPIDEHITGKWMAWSRKEDFPLQTVGFSNSMLVSRRAAISGRDCSRPRDLIPHGTLEPRSGFRATQREFPTLAV